MVRWQRFSCGYKSNCRPMYCKDVRKDTNTVLTAIFASKAELAGYPLDIVGFDAKFYGRMPLLVPTTRNALFISETV